MSDDANPSLPCSECGKYLLQGDFTECFSFGAPRPFKAAFCSRACAEKYQPDVLTMHKLNALAAWLKAKGGTQ